MWTDLQLSVTQIEALRLVYANAYKFMKNDF